MQPLKHLQGAKALLGLGTRLEEGGKGYLVEGQSCGLHPRRPLGREGGREGVRVGTGTKVGHTTFS